MSIGASNQVGNHHDKEYDVFLSRVRIRFLKNCDNGNKPLFTTDVENLWELYLNSFTDPKERQYHNCNACRRFIERYGSLATIDVNSDSGMVASAVWDEEDAPEQYKAAVAAMAKAVRRAKITGVFISSEKVWGNPVTGVWQHVAVYAAPNMIFKKAMQTAGQAMAEKKEDFLTVSRALNEFTLDHLDMAVTLLETDSLYRSEKVLGQAKWLRFLKAAHTINHSSNKENVVWAAVATAPAGFCHPRSSMIGTLLEDISAGKSYQEVSKAFAEKMHPLSYQRPKAAPSDGAIAQAEKIVGELNAAGSLARRFARLEDIQALWLPKPKKEEVKAGGVFGHLKNKEKDQHVLPGYIPTHTMTWEKFRREVLPMAERIQFRTPSRGSYTALVTSVNADSPPIIQWDREDRRNPVSWYFWHSGAPATQFGLQGDTFVDVDAVTLKPHMWNGGFEHHNVGVMFVLSGAKESRISGSALFPEILKSEFHPVRSVLEAHSRQGTIEGKDEPHVAGFMLDKGDTWNCLLRVWRNGTPLDYRLDRWD